MWKEKAIEKMKAVFKDIPYGIDHTLKVLENAELIMAGEIYPEADRELVSMIAILHDIGALEALKKHGSMEGVYQEIEGPAIAEAILKDISYPEDKAARVVFVVGNHHSPSKIDGLDFQILWEADLLENMTTLDFLDDQERLKAFIEKQFKTQTGRNTALARFHAERDMM